VKYDVTLQTIAWINGRRSDKTLEISPKFQRRPVWLAAERSDLMATILEDLPFPEIYIHHQTNLDDGTERHIVVDGQQRVTSILKFIDNEIELPDSTRWKGAGFRNLSPEERERFWNYKIVVRGLSQTNDAEIRDLFIRLNTNNIALNDQELRNARHKGRFKQLAERMADNPLFQNLALFTPRDIRRMLDVEFTSELLLLTVEGVTNKKDILDDAYAAYDEELPREAEFEEEFNSIIGLIRTIITDANKGQIKRKSNFYSIYGACLRYFRDTHRAAFQQPNEVSSRVGALLLDARDGALEGKADFVAKYYDAVTRAASDKGRRIEREQILYDLIASAEKQIPLT